MQKLPAIHGVDAARKKLAQCDRQWNDQLATAHIKKGQALTYPPSSLIPTTQTAIGRVRVRALVKLLFFSQTSQRGDAGAAALDEGGDFVKVAGAHLLLVRHKVLSHADVAAPVCLYVAEKRSWNLTDPFTALC